MLAAVALSQHPPCPRPAIAVAPREPYVTRGPTEVVVGLYVQGGALIQGCRQQPRGPDAGTVTLRAPTGAIVASQTLRDAGKLFVLHVGPGTYTLGARMGDGLRLLATSVTVREGRTVRQDLFEDVP
ncbi:MAG: hypothetical protein ABR946_06230 [Solirubrobacteraceae bacterium]|jgi:hypothetical protein